MSEFFPQGDGGAPDLPTRSSRADAAAHVGGRRRSPLVRLGIVLGVLVALAALVAVAVGGFLWWSVGSRVRHVDVTLDTPAATAPQSDQSTGTVSTRRPITYLVMGSDSRQSGGDPTDWDYGAQRSDVLMLAQVSADRSHVSVMSIPRDSWVDIPDHDTAKINAAYSWGGASLTIQTVEQLTGISIDHFLIVDFASFEELTNILGGVTIDTVDGPQTMNGERALAFVRERYSLPAGDFDRVRRQQAWMHAILQGVFEQGVLNSVPKTMPMINAILDHSAVDSGLNLSTMLSTIGELRGIRSDDVTFFTAPVTGTGTSADGQSIVLLDEDLFGQVCAAWREDRLASFLDSTSGIVTLDSSPVR